MGLSVRSFICLSSVFGSIYKLSILNKPKTLSSRLLHMSLGDLHSTVTISRISISVVLLYINLIAQSLK